jgi:putative redox protein
MAANTAYSVNVRLCRNFQFIGMDHAGHSVVMDASKPEGEGSGATPMNILLFALGGCTGMDIVQGLKKTGQKLTGLEIGVTGERNDRSPRYYTKIHIHYKVSGDVKEDLLTKAIQDSQEIFCSVAATLNGKAVITTSYELNKVQ